MATIWLKICVAGPETTLPFMVTVKISSPAEGVDEDDREEELCGLEEDDCPPEDEVGRDEEDCPEEEDGLEEDEPDADEDPDDEPDEDADEEPEPDDDKEDDDDEELSSSVICSNSQLSLSYTSWA